MSIILKRLKAKYEYKYLDRVQAQRILNSERNSTGVTQKQRTVISSISRPLVRRASRSDHFQCECKHQLAIVCHGRLERRRLEYMNTPVRLCVTSRCVPIVFVAIEAKFQLSVTITILTPINTVRRYHKILRKYKMVVLDSTSSSLFKQICICFELI